MAKLEGIIYNTFYGYVVLRGFAPIGELAEVSKKPKSYQRDADDHHKLDIIKYLSGTKSYFPEITLACRVSDYEGLIQSIGTDKDISKEESAFVKGLYVLSERLPMGRDRARHAYLEIKKPTYEEKLVRVDGNHRLEPFSSDIDWWHQLVTNRDAIKDEPDEVKIKGWLDHEAKAVRSSISQKIVPFTIVMSDAKDANSFEAKIFHDINFKALPLREEASLKIVSDLNAFEIDELGVEYPLTLELIKEVKRGVFSTIPWLTVETEEEMDADTEIVQSFFRTTCLRIVQLLLSQKERINKLLSETHNKSKVLENQINEQERAIEKLEKDIEEKKLAIEQIEIENAYFKDMSLYKSAVREYEDIMLKLNMSRNDYDILIQERYHLKYKVDSLTRYIDNCDNKNAILSSLTTLTAIYKEFEGENYGNISYLCALVYYSLLDTEQLNSFVEWSKQNGINKITEPDDLSKDASRNLIKMFDQIHQAKKNEIFISMQFGDSQSELIFEKIVRAIELFNSKHKDINLRATPIRIDRTVESSTYSIQDKIKEAIKSCGLIIADLSSANINVYHEIGYAMGIAESHNMIPNIVLLYKENTDHNTGNKDVDKFVGFNLRNLSQLRFKEYDQLVDGLVKRLEKHYYV